LIFPPNDLTKGLQQQVLMLQVVPEQSLSEAMFHVARYVQHVEDNPVYPEILYKTLLEENSQNTNVRIELIQLYLKQRRYDEVVNQTLLAAKTLAAPERAKLLNQVSELLIAAGQTDAAKKLEPDE
jgi:hypothetical protein